MASVMFAIECPNCGRSAIEDSYYKTEEKTINCYRCGYDYSERTNDFTTIPIQYTKEEFGGHGLFVLMKKDGEGEISIFTDEISKENVAECNKAFCENDTDQESSYLVTYREGVFTIHCGKPSENFHLSFEQYKMKMREKYGADYDEYLVPIED